MDFVPNSRRIRFVLCDPSHPGNIGAAARAINTMGFGRLYVVNPRERNYRRDPEAIALCTHSTDVLGNSVCVDTLEQALEGVRMAFALSGYDREFGPPMRSVTEACGEAKGLLDDEGIEVAFVFGTERSGLTNEQIMRCQRCVAIPANPECDSLNLAQAVQVTAYQLQTALRGDRLTEESRRFAGDPPASAESLAKMYSHLEEALTATGALNPEKPKFMMQRLRHLFSRATLTQSEVDMLRGICASMIRSKAERVGTKKRPLQSPS